MQLRGVCEVHANAAILWVGVLDVRFNVTVGDLWVVVVVDGC